MRKVLTTLALLLSFLTVGGGVAMASPAELPACQFEDSTNCFWDADVQGNGQGVSFHDIDGVAYYECDGAEDSANCYWDAQAQGNGQGSSFTDVAGQAVYWDGADTAQAWAAWDLTNASDLLPSDTATQVIYSGSYDGHALNSHEIAVWDSTGSYLFTF